MKKKDSATGIHSLKWFMIQRFLLVMLFVFITEELIGVFYRNWLVLFLSDIMHVSEVSFSYKEGSILLVVLRQLLLSGAEFLPKQTGQWITHLIGSNLDNVMPLTMHSTVLDNVSNDRIRVTYQFAVLMIYLVMLAITLLPYVVAALWYGWVISRKVKELMEEEKKRKEEYDRQKNLLLSDIAHDIKTPITTICGYAGALADNMVLEEPKKQEYLQAIYTKSLRMSELITLLFEYVQLDSSGFVLHKEKGDVGELLRENVALLYSDFEEKGIELKIDIPEQEFPYEMDKIQMARAVSNILTNMVRYNEKGNVVAVRLDDSYQIRIGDNGIPISDELAAHIFEPFSRGDAARSTTGGTGLGLSIAAKIVEMHGGSLQLIRNSREGYVKEFQIVLK